MEIKIGSILEVEVDTPRFTFIKRKDDGSIDYISPIPSPFNYGSVPNTIAEDGDRVDAIILGEKVEQGDCKSAPVRAIVRFYDKGKEDFKYVCSENNLTFFDEALLNLFFIFFGFAKRMLNRVRGKKGVTFFDILQR